MESAEKCFSWYSVGKSINNRYPLWANQLDLWPPNINTEHADEWYSLCFSFVLAENRCLVTKFEESNPVEEALEVYIDNPLCPTNPESFWATQLSPRLQNLDPTSPAHTLSSTIKDLYLYWNLNYCKGQHIENVGLKDEPYFKYFAYPDFLTPSSGLIQIKRFAEVGGLNDLLVRFDLITEQSKVVKDRIYKLLVEDFKYFEK